MLFGLFYFFGVFSRDTIFDNYRFKIDSLDTVISLFPKSVGTIQKQKDKIFESAKHEIQKILKLVPEKRTFENTVIAVDKVLNDLETFEGVLHTIANVHINKQMRDFSLKTAVQTGTYSLSLVLGNKDLYKVFKSYVDTQSKKEKLNKEQRYFLDEMIDQFKRAGFGLSNENCKKVNNLHKEILSLCADFQKNINSDNRFILVKDSELAGLQKDFVKNLKLSKNGLRVVRLDYPTYYNIMKNCENFETRKKLYEQYVNRGYPVNDGVLKKIIKKRDQLAKLLGYDSYANYDCSNQMIGSCKKVELFVDSLFETVAKKAKNELSTCITGLDNCIQITKDNKIYPWDISYMQELYKKKNYNLDESKISEYLPLEKTLEVLQDVCKKLFSISLQEVSNNGLWHQDVKVLKVSRLSDNFVLGYIIMDLYPREDKFPHACAIPVFAGLIDDTGNRGTAVVTVLANFPKPTKDKPSLLNMQNITTFFHEVGHALHGIFGATKFAIFAGTSTKKDFVELPSQLMEYFVWEPEILKQLSCHYKTGEPLPDDLIAKMIDLKNFGYGFSVQLQLFYSMVALNMFKSGEDKDPKRIIKDLHSKMLKKIVYADCNNMHSAFIHLTGYAAKYYGYMYSRMLALDAYDTIKKNGLLDPAIGKKYIDCILSKGGSFDPNSLVRDFLGREPSNRAFIEYYGFA